MILVARELRTDGIVMLLFLFSAQPRFDNGYTLPWPFLVFCEGISRWIIGWSRLVFTAPCGWHVCCTVVRAVAWPLLLSVTHYHGLTVKVTSLHWHRSCECYMPCLGSGYGVLVSQRA